MRASRFASGAFLAALVAALDSARAGAAPACPPTAEDVLGPFYRPDAPVRTSVGKGHVLRGTVRSSADCSPIPGARVELWLAGRNGYDDAHRATVIAEAEGRPPHIHVRVAHPGHRTLVTQEYPAQGKAEETFDLVLSPAR